MVVYGSNIYLHNCLFCTEVVPVRLVNGSNQAEGRIEVQHNGQWGTVCNYFRDLDIGTVVCHQLGYKKVAKMYDYPYFGQGSGPVWLRPRCKGTESSLGHCNFWKWNVYDWWCNHEHDAGVVCTNGEWLTQHGRLLDNACCKLCHTHDLVVLLLASPWTLRNSGWEG